MLLAVILAASSGLLACPSVQSNEQLCETYVGSSEHTGWMLQATAPPGLEGRSPPVLPQEFLDVADHEAVHFVWFRNSGGDHGACAVDPSSECAFAFLTYKNGALDAEPTGIRISTCGW